MQRTIRLCALLAPMAFSLMACPVLADAPFAPPTPMVDPYTAKPGPKSVATGFTLDGLHGVLEKTKLADVAKHLGGQIAHQGDASTALAWLCYDLPAQHLRVWLSADEMHGGAGGEVNTVTVWTVASPANSRQCPVIAGNPSIDVDGVAVGQAETAVKARLGLPGLAKEGWTAYSHKAAQGGGFEEDDYLVVKIEGSRVGYLQASRLTSN